MKRIRLTEEAYYKYRDGMGFEPADRYEAHGVDEDGNEYQVVWYISDWEAFEDGREEDACDWDKPDLVYDWDNDEEITDYIIER